MKVVRSAAAACILALPLSILGTAACGFSDEEAQERCDQEQEAREGGGCFTLATYDACVEAFKECGDDVVPNDGCPLQYACPE